LNEFNAVGAAIDTAVILDGDVGDVFDDTLRERIPAKKLFADPAGIGTVWFETAFQIGGVDKAHDKHETETQKEQGDGEEGKNFDFHDDLLL
jgi:hypothetical protein